VLAEPLDEPVLSAQTAPQVPVARGKGVGMDPGSINPGSINPGSIDPGSIDPGSMGPGSIDPGSIDPGSIDPGSMGPGSMGPGSIDPGSMGPGSTAPPLSLKPADLVLEGGGVKGIALVGAICALEEAGWTFKRVAGTSAGSIVGSLVAAQLPGTEIHDLMAALDYTRFRDKTLLDHLPLAGRGLSALFEHGIYKGDYALDWVRAHLAAARVHTFADLADDDPDSALPPDMRYRLIVHASDVTRGDLLRLPWSYRPGFDLDPREQSVADAVRASMSIPFFFRWVQLKPRKGPSSVLVDGGMLSNFPIDVFDRTDGRPSRWPTIGIKLSAQQPPDTISHDVEGDISLAEAMLATLTSWYDQMHLHDPAAVRRTIFVDTMGIPSTDFSITRDQQRQLFENGQVAARNWLDKNPDGRPAQG